VSGTLLGIDLGEKRIGLAIAEADGLSARPLMTVQRGRDLDADATTLGPIATSNGAVGLVVGLPLNANGDEGPMAVAARAWAAEIGTRLGLPVTLRDERLSSHVAEGRLGPMPRGRSGGPPSRSQRERYRARVDREAASVILQDEIEARRAR
jgi:putative Holliday junction resolvase